MTAPLPRRPWEDPAAAQRNRLPGRPVGTEEAVADGPGPEAAAAPDALRAIDLSAGWRRLRLPSPSALPADALQGPHPEWEDAPRVAEAVRGSASGLPFPVLPPLVPSSNPTTVLERELALAAEDLAGDARLVLDDVVGFARVFANGTWIGTVSGDGMPASFDAGAHLAPGRNVLTLVVQSFSAGSYVTAPERLHAPGLAGGARLSLLPTTHLDRVAIRTARRDDGWELVAAAEAHGGQAVEVELSDLGRTVWRATARGGRAQALLRSVEPWRPGAPRLYDLRITRGARGRAQTFLRLAVGFPDAGLRDPESIAALAPRVLPTARPDTQLTSADAAGDAVVLGLGPDLGALAASGPDALAEVIDDPAWEELLADRAERTVATFAAHPSLVAWGVDPAGLVDEPDGRRVAGRSLAAAVRRGAALDPDRPVVALDDLRPVVIPAAEDATAADTTAEEAGPERSSLAGRLTAAAPRVRDLPPAGAPDGAGDARTVTRRGSALHVSSARAEAVLDMTTGAFRLYRADHDDAVLAVAPALDVRSVRAGRVGGLPVVDLTGLVGTSGTRTAQAVAERWRLQSDGALRVTRAVRPGDSVPDLGIRRTGDGPGPRVDRTGAGAERSWTIRWPD